MTSVGVESLTRVNTPSSENKSLWINTSSLISQTPSLLDLDKSIQGFSQANPDPSPYFPSPARTATSDGMYQQPHFSHNAYFDFLNSSTSTNPSGGPIMKPFLDTSLMFQTMSPAMTPEDSANGYLSYHSSYDEPENALSFTDLLGSSTNLSETSAASSIGGGPMRAHQRSMSLDTSMLPFPGGLASANSVYTPGPLSSASTGLGQFQNLTLFSPPGSANESLLSPLVYSTDGLSPHTQLYSDSPDGAFAYSPSTSDFMHPMTFANSSQIESPTIAAAGSGGARGTRQARRSYSVGSLAIVPTISPLPNPPTPKSLNRPVQPSPLSIGAYSTMDTSSTSVANFTMPDIQEEVYKQDAFNVHQQQSKSESAVSSGNLPTPVGIVKTKPSPISPPPAEIHITSSTREDGTEYFPCPHCDREFARIQDIKRHLPVHYKPVREFECETCHTNFTRNDALRRHIRQGKCEGALRRQEKKRRLNMMMGMAMNF